MPNSPLTDTLAPLAELGVETRLDAREGDGWVPAASLTRDRRAQRSALAEIGDSLGTDRADVCASLLIEVWTWLVAAPAAAALVARARLPDVSTGNVLMRPRGGLADWRSGLRTNRFHALPSDPDIAHPDAVPASAEAELLDRLGVTLVHHLAPLVESLNLLARRPRRALWRGAADRVAGAFLWVGEELGERERSHALARRAVASAPELGTPIRVQRVGSGPDATHVHLRHGCCLYYRVPGAPKCIGCPLLSEEERVERSFSTQPTG
jgi:ferric iron reductase protein FhuF